MRQILGVILMLFAAVSLSALVSCGKSHSANQPGISQTPLLDMTDESSNGFDVYNHGGNQGLERRIALSDAIIDVMNTEAPTGVDPELFDQLKAKLLSEFQRLYTPQGTFRGDERNSSAISFVDGAQAWCAQGSISTGGTVTLYWRGRLQGDYDLDGEVGIPDITPIAENYLKTVNLDADGLPVVSGDNEYLAQVDGDASLDVGVSDITPIALNYLMKLNGYRLYYGISDDGTNIDWQPSFIPNPDDAGLPYTMPYNASRDSGQVQRFEISFPYPDLTAPAELFVKVVAYDGQQEGSETIIPVPEGPHMAFKCELCHRVTDYQFRGEATVCQTCHAKPPDNTSKSWSDAPGSHSTCMTCHQSHGFAISQPETVCVNCHTDITTRVTSSLMSSCSMCHQSFHVPNVPTDTTTCTSCHANPPENPSADWITARTEHANCFNCHSNHNFKVTDIPGTCSSCHSAISIKVAASKMTDCFDCHEAPHLPVASPDVSICSTCHPNPPENPSAEWTTAPGQHNECAQCHGNHDFAITASPAVCGSCHTTQATELTGSLMQNCVDCHDAPHLPTGSPQPTICQDCHTTPPENSSLSWANAPGQHATCALCHPSHIFAVADPSALCSTCHTSETTELAASQMAGTACLECHDSQHVPTAEPQPAKCQTCHTTPPENASLSWTNAPGQHGTCSACHSSHGFAIADANAVCANCHASIATELAASGKPTLCLECHESQHVPTADPSPESCNTCHAAIAASLADEAMNDCGLCHSSHDFGQTYSQAFCMSCHPNPPEEPTTPWSATKAQHRICSNCHNLHDFKVDQPSSVCTHCHSQHSNPEDHNSFACLQCHLVPHLPETEQDIVCNLCH